MGTILLSEPVTRVAGGAHARVEQIARLLGDPSVTDIESALDLLALTDKVARDAAGHLGTISAADRYTGSHANLVMLSFLQPQRQRFNDDSFGAWYAAIDEKTAYEEKRYHLTRWLSRAGSLSFDLRQFVLTASIIDQLENVRRGEDGVDDEVYNPDPDRYDAANALAKQRRSAGARGLYYDSVRHIGGLCCAIYRPAAITNVAIRDELHLEWDGNALRGFKEI